MYSLFRTNAQLGTDETKLSVVGSTVGNDIESISEGSGVLPGK